MRFENSQQFSEFELEFNKNLGEDIHLKPKCIRSLEYHPNVDWKIPIFKCKIQLFGCAVFNPIVEYYVIKVNKREKLISFEFIPLFVCTLCEHFLFCFANCKSASLYCICSFTQHSAFDNVEK